MAYITGWGQATLPGDEYARERVEFRRAVVQMAPDVMARIRDDAFPAYQRLWALVPGVTTRMELRAAGNLEAAERDEIVGIILARAPEAVEAELTLERALEDATPPGLRVEWWHVANVEDFKDWCEQPACEGEWGYGGPCVQTIPRNEETLFRIPFGKITRSLNIKDQDGEAVWLREEDHAVRQQMFWDPGGDVTEAEFRKRMTDCFQQSLDAYVEAQAKRSRDMGLRAAKVRRKSDRLAWFVHRQALGWGNQRILEAFGIEEERTLTKAFEELRCLGLPNSK